MTSTQQTPKFTADQRVEVYVTDFQTPGFPKTWKPATVTAVTQREDRLFDVMVTRDDGAYAHQIVGSRGGNRNIRPLRAMNVDPLPEYHVDNDGHTIHDA